MSQLIIRSAQEDDVQEMAGLDRVCFADPWSEESFAYELKLNQRAFYIAAEIEGRLVGYAGLWAILDEGHITNVAVAPEYRRKGIGRALVTSLMEVAEENGLTSFTLEVRESNLPAQKLYTELDFKPAGIRKGYYHDNGENAVIMWRGRE
ncbi:ribosomal protein S18-alanine N-acetyltransferase [Aminipila butyrica]|uniref:[Ribosomal protein bS18]-alanine N-acetyltransferase n=1 Tax=Aminipila butyrica TaxID=433296 RepID=A0A858C1J0_9FIRM|nr:ribosomal protein S18-alanine N-acetyltransferase [Aminipila butyrica]QIB70406.1 ribosomal protein S18-alanine N-acetyltransferase [Aminipila butyrica]